MKKRVIKENDKLKKMEHLKGKKTSLVFEEIFGGVNKKEGESKVD
jgi:hypothetical protein